MAQTPRTLRRIATTRHRGLTSVDRPHRKGLKRVEVFIADADIEGLKAMAADQGLSLSATVRMLIRIAIRKHRATVDREQRPT